MNLKTMTDANLIERTETLVREERELLTKVLHHLREIDRRRLFSSLGYKSLFDFAVRHLGYPEDQAYRRISAMKLLKEIPEIEAKINQGEISLTHIGLAQTLFRQEKRFQQKEMSSNQKLSVLEKIANKSVREAERITLSLSSTSGAAMKPDRMNAVSENLIELKFTASLDLQEKIERLKGFLAHKHPNISLGELFERLCDLGLSEWTPGARRKNVPAASAKVPSVSRIKSSPAALTETPTNTPAAPTKPCSAAPAKPCSVLPTKPSSAAPRNRRVIGAPSKARIIREAFQKSKNKCEHCSSHYALEVDHIIPLAKGGSSMAQNLRILCRSCNQRAAIREFGIQKMDRYLNSNHRTV